ncbi:hypothetical protein [Endozoicomonas ascidiicola]|uniref:hypothetical protein n=1 Tax=Endozoicomonas ascidiicola TaxID=1698521 RepID=UPI000835AF02|nr:hypothetical protein [Endozoicomonas ascidiicola]
MSDIITTDFETFFRSRQNKGTPGEKYSLSGCTYEQYFYDPRFKGHGFSYQIGNLSPEWVSHDRMFEALNDLFPAGNKNTMIAHNAYFESAIMEWMFGLEAHRYWCTMSMSKAVWPQSPANLEALSKRCYPEESSKWKRKEDLDVSDGIRDLDDTQEIIIGEYCNQDVHSTFHAFKKMWNMGFPRKELDVIDLTIKMFVRRYFKADRPLLEAHLKHLTEKRERIVAQSGTTAEILGSNPKFAKHLKDTHGIIVDMVDSPTKKNPDNMKLPLAKDDMEFINLQEDYPQLNYLWEARLECNSNGEITRTQTFLTNSEIHPLNPDGRLAAYLGYYNAHTGRFGGGNKTNCQNLGRNSQLRPSLRAPKGYKMVIRDQSSIEARMLLWFCGQWDKMEYIADGGDIYNLIGEEIFGYPIQRKDPKFKREGFMSKMTALGIGYQLGWRSYKRTLATSDMRMIVEDDEAKNVVHTWRRSHPAVVSMWKNLELVIHHMTNPDLEPYTLGTADCIRVEYCRLVLPNGLALNYPKLHKVEHPDARNEYEYWNGKYYKKLYPGLLVENIIQSLSRISMTDAMVTLHNQWTDQNLDAHIALTVHDEIIAVCREDLTEQINSDMQQAMATTPEWADERLVLSSSGLISDHYMKD